MAASKKFWDVALVGVTIGGIAVGLYGLATSIMARTTLELQIAENTRLVEENSTLRMQLVEMQPVEKTVEMSFTVGSHEFAPKTLARANRNLLNIRYFGGEKFKGFIGVDKDRHIIFAHPAYSVRAGAMILKNYEERHGIRTVEDMIKRFAEGNQEQYIAFVCKHLGVKPKQKISLKKNLHKLLPIMIKFETGESVGVEYTEIIKAVLG